MLKLIVSSVLHYIVKLFFVSCISSALGVNFILSIYVGFVTQRFDIV
jgi:hypothetical protein